ncbi:helix-turn-helix transcriptional regulator [Rhodoferax sp.]|uniref:helix-turn-helix domain-containing protein n=1 Tax=Rhodoferax sp. TaxID=50421 RepID=UPI002723A492|nr:helix-turn-helix transcriptional regulator [Rhodoferax sp.]MDO9195335.1 helix-turn-helix transcriptional regulator [Rhodoferax sp.]
MKIRELIDTAAAKSQQTQIEIAEELGIKPARLSEWKSGQRKPDANEIAFFAEKADLAVLATVAEIEAELNPRYAAIWKNAVSQISKIRVNP